LFKNSAIFPKGLWLFTYGKGLSKFWDNRLFLTVFHDWFVMGNDMENIKKAFFKN